MELREHDEVAGPGAVDDGGTWVAVRPAPPGAEGTWLLVAGMGPREDPETTITVPLVDSSRQVLRRMLSTDAEAAATRAIEASLIVTILARLVEEYEGRVTEGASRRAWALLWTEHGPEIVEALEQPDGPRGAQLPGERDRMTAPGWRRWIDVLASHALRLHGEGEDAPRVVAAVHAAEAWRRLAGPGCTMED